MNLNATRIWQKKFRFRAQDKKQQLYKEQYWNNEWLLAPLHFGSTNNIFADCKSFVLRVGYNNLIKYSS